MRIKRFIAPDMRTALRMVRDEQGPDAVILSNRSLDGGGIEVVAATDYDEALVAQALRAAAPGLETIVAHAHAPAPMAMTGHADGSFASIAAHLAAAAAVNAPAPALVHAGSAAAVAERVAAASVTPLNATAIHSTPGDIRVPARDRLAARARAVFRIGDGPTLAELASVATAPAAGIPVLAPVAAVDDADDVTVPALTRLEAMLAAMGAPAAPAIAATLNSAAAATVNAVTANTAPAAIAAPAATETPGPIAAPGSFAAAIAAATFEPDDWASTGDDYHVALSAVAMPVAPLDDVAIALIDTGSQAHIAFAPAPAPTSVTALHAGTEAPDPSMLAMREELASMRQLIERQMDQYSLERLRGSPARAAAYEALLGYGCGDALAQTVAAKLDPRLPVDAIQAPMFTELARLLTIARSEPLDDGGVIALVGPTGAGKTTTAARLAARFAARHSARDVALVTTDGERTGAREQLHALGRRLGITVCDADNGEGLGHTLDQLVDYPLVLVDTAGYGVRDRAGLRQILWLRASSQVRSLLVLPANAHPHDLGEVIRRYRPAAPEGVVLTKLDETGRLGAALSVLVDHGLSLAYTSAGQQVPTDLEAADAGRLVMQLEKTPRAADNPLATEDRHAFA